MPKVTVIMPVYNTDSQYLKAAVTSIQCQTYQDWELLLYDDGSKQSYVQAIRQIAAKEEKMRVMYAQKNRGAGYARNVCIKAARGTYVAIMDADDISAQNRLEKQVDFLDTHPQYAFVGSNAYLIDKDGVWGRRVLEKTPGKESFLQTLPFIHPSVMIRKEVLDALHGYSEKKQDYRVEDYELMIRLYAEGYRGYNMPEMLFYYREDENSFQKRKYRYRIDECRMRYFGFQKLGILKGHLRYVLKPLIIGLIPANMMCRIRRVRYRVKNIPAGVSQTGKRTDIRKPDDIKIFVSHTPGSKNVRIHAPFFYHVMAGSDLQKETLPEDMLADNSGDHISYLNPFYCELTTQYWAWKNVEADYYGFCHYRRYFSFASELYPQADCGCLVYPFLNKKIWKKLYPGEHAVRQKVLQYDCLIAKGIPVRMLGAANIYEHYANAPGLKKQDFDIFLKLVCKRYPKLKQAVKSYLHGRIFYPCNLFVMKKELFMEYSGMLFSLLEEFHYHVSRADDSREGQRTPGHLGERFLGIYYTYLRQQGFRTGELQMALFEHTQAEVWHQPLPEEIPIVLACDSGYVPVLFTCIKSLALHCSAQRAYHIYIFHTDICEADRQVFQKELANPKLRIDFVDVSARIAGYRLKAKGHISNATYYRFLILDVLKECQKVIYLDADVIVCKDLANLYDLPLGDALLAAAVDADFIGQYYGANPDTEEYCRNVLALKHPSRYVQAGVIVLQVKALNQKTSAKELMNMAQRRDYRYSDQDILNIVCQGRIKILDLAWNVCADSGNKRYSIIRFAPFGILQAYEQAREQPFIIHYSGDSKPWQNPQMDFAGEFWKTARNTPYYETLLGQIKQKQGRLFRYVKIAVRGIKQVCKKLLPKGSLVRRMLVSVYWKLK